MSTSLFYLPPLIIIQLVMHMTWPHTAEAHAGRTNAQGCHAGSKPYHCHDKAPKVRKVNRTRPGVGCDPNYSGCVPIASDVDCYPGRGNGPAYLRETVEVIGTDIYRLDRDKDGLACERD